MMDGAYYAVIPADVRYDKDLKPNAKLLYGEITSLCNQKGYCWATNKYFSDLYGLAEETISRLITQLERKGYIRCEMATTEKGSERRIYAGIFLVSQGGLDENVNPPPDENVKGGLDEKVKQNNKEFNNKDLIPSKAPQRGRRAQSEAKWKPERFDAFWAYYCKHGRGEARQKAIKAWDKLHPDDALIDEMARALARQVTAEDWRRGIGIPYASSWLNGRRWEDIPQQACDRSHAPARTVESEAVPEW